MIKHAFNALKLLNDKGLSCGLTLGRNRSDLQEKWSTIGCRIDHYNVLFDLHDVAEISFCPPYTDVPGTQGWVNGLVNIRGGLALIIDVKGYFGMGATSTSRESRVIYLNTPEFFTGLLVDQILGKRYFKASEKVSDDEIDKTIRSRYLQSFISSVYRQNDQIWLVFNVSKLVAAQRFIDVAV